MEAAQITPPRKYAGKSADQRRTERRAQVIEAGLAIWQEQGWAAVTMRGVCSRAGLTDRYFYESFRDRDDLLGTIWDQKRDETLEMLLEALGPYLTAPPLEQLHAVLVAVMHHVADEPARAQIIFGDHAGSALLEKRRHDLIQVVTDLMIGMGRPYLRAGADENALRINTLLGIGGFVELMLSWRSGVVEGDPDTLVGHLDNVAAALAAPFLAAP